MQETQFYPHDRVHVSNSSKEYTCSNYHLKWRSRKEMKMNDHST